MYLKKRSNNKYCLEFERLQFGQEIVVKLLEAERDARSTTERYSHEEVFSILYGL